MSEPRAISLDPSDGTNQRLNSDKIDTDVKYYVYIYTYVMVYRLELIGHDNRSRMSLAGNLYQSADKNVQWFVLSR